MKNHDQTEKMIGKRTTFKETLKETKARRLAREAASANKPKVTEKVVDLISTAIVNTLP
jgi:hypothetical protein